MMLSDLHLGRLLVLDEGSSGGATPTVTLNGFIIKYDCFMPTASVGN